MIRFKRTTWILLLISTVLRAGEYADAFLLSSNYPQVQALGLSSVAAIVTSGHNLNNPAGFALGSASRITMVYENFSDLSTNYALEATKPIGSKYQMGLSLFHSSIDDLYVRPYLSGLSPRARRDSVLALAGDPGESIPYREDAVFLTLARELNFKIDLGWIFFKIPCRVPLGVSAKYIDKLLVENRGLGVGIDVGGQIFYSLAGMTDVLANTEFSYGLFISDVLNTPVYWNSQHQDAIKRNITMGYAISQELLKYDTKITFSSGSNRLYHELSRYGMEINIKELISIRGGHDGYTTSFGLGIGLKKFIIDYSFSQHELSDMQKIGIIYRW